jgi:hypothetical protein
MSDDRKPFAFQPDHDGTLTIESAVFQALGAASVCWSDMSGTGVFEDQRAKEIGETLLAFIANRNEAIEAAS